MNKKLDYRITIIQYIMSILIVILHSRDIDTWGLRGDSDYIVICQLQNIMAKICTIAVPVFFFFSGYLFFCSFNTDNVPLSYLEKLKSRVRSLLLPYLFWNIIAWCVYALFNPLEKFNFISIFLEIINSQYNGDYNPLWYMRNIIIISVLSIIIFYALKNKILGLLALFGSFIVNLIFEFNYFGIIYWLPEYLLGAYLGIHFKKFCFDEVKKKVWILILEIVLLICFGTISSLFDNYRLLYLYRLEASVSIPLILGSLMGKKDNIQWWMKISSFIYYTHFLIIGKIQAIFLLLLGKTVASATICFISTPIVVIFILSVLFFFWRKVHPQSLNLLLGERI